jgi:hypothetical protein
MKRILIIFVSAVTVLLFASCGFINGLLDGMSGNWTGNPEYTLSIEYEYQGVFPVRTGSPIIFWVMPLDSSGKVQEDPDDPGGSPLRKELYAYEPYGMISDDIESGDYALLAFVDDNGDGSLNLGDSYVLYDDRSIADSSFDTIEIFGNFSMYVWFGDTYTWHAVFIREPREDQTMYESFWSHGGFFGNEISEIDVQVDNGSWFPASVDHENDYWQFFVDVTQLSPGIYHDLTVAAKDTLGNTIDSSSVHFYY